jgi:hypothetical protein
MTPLSSARTLSSSRFPIILTVLAAITITTGCGSAGSSSTGGGQKLSGNTSVAVLLTSTANDQLSEFGMVFQGLALTSQSGKTVNLLPANQGAEFMVVNGTAAPFLAVSIPQDVYTSATATIGGTQFTCMTVAGPNTTSPGSLVESTYAYGYVPSSFVTVNLPSPITITGASMGLSLDLLVSQSATVSSCYQPDGTPTYSITPTFSLTPIALSSHPTSPANGKVAQLEGEITAIAATGNSFTLVPPGVALTCPCPQPGTLTVSADSNTVYQGVNSFSALAVGTLVDMDGAIQPDGSALAMRLGAYDPAALNVMIGPLVFVYGYGPQFYSLGRQQQGQDYSVQGQSLGIYSFSDATVFQTSGQFSNVASLPFTASFSGSNMVPGQNVAVYSQTLNDFYGGQYTAATTMTLMPQTINATLVSSSTSGNFTVYSVFLSPDDLFPALAVQPGQNTLLTNPGEVEVYVDSNTQKLNTMALAPGSTLRFNGLVFNDNGTLRMDCGQVNDGVSFSQANSGERLETGKMQSAVREGARGMQPTITVVTRSYQVRP